MEMKLYCFQVGAIRFSPAEDALPIYAYLIEHPKGRVLVDTGESYALRDENAVMAEEDTILPQLRKLGYTPADIDYVVLSHLHLDHAGYMSAFPDATFIVRREELRAAWWPEPYEHGYLLANYENTRDFRYIQLGNDEDYDVFMDGSILLIDTRGRSRATSPSCSTCPTPARPSSPSTPRRIRKFWTGGIPAVPSWTQGRKRAP